MQLKLILSLVALTALCIPAFGQTTAAGWFEEGIALHKQGKYNEAIKAYDEAIRLDPKYAEAWCNKGSVLLMQRKDDEAIKAYDEAIKLNSSEPSYWNDKGYVFYVQGRYDEAIKCYDEAIRLDPTYVDALNDKANALAHIPSVESPAGKHSCLIGTSGIN